MIDLGSGGGLPGLVVATEWPDVDLALLRLLDLAPTGRLLVGSDGHGVPETHWFALGVTGGR